MTYLTDFLRARIAEDEAVARECLKPENLHPYGDKRIPAIKPEEWGELADNYLGGEMGVHAARHDPLRVLAECRAKRKIIRLHLDLSESDYPGLGMAWEATKTVLKLTASSYKGHPDYLEEWER